MIRVMALATVFLGFTAPLPRGPAGAAPLPRSPAAPPASLAEVGDSARVAWQRRDLAAFVAPALGGRLLVTLPPGNQSAPISGGPGQSATFVVCTRYRRGYDTVDRGQGGGFAPGVRGVEPALPAGGDSGGAPDDDPARIPARANGLGADRGPDRPVGIPLR